MTVRRWHILTASAGLTLAWCYTITVMSGYLTWDWWPL